MTKIIFAVNCVFCRIETTSDIVAVSVEEICTVLPPGQTTVTTLMATDIHIFHFLTNMYSQKIYDVKIYEFSSDVINMVNTLGWKAAGRSLVSGLVTKVNHHAQTHSVFVPVWKIFVYGGIVRKWC